VAAAPSGVLIVQNLSPERVVAALTANHVPFTEVSVHRATLEEAYLELARDAADFRAVPPAQVPR
jgi:ABC-2 type transport system ATP-binding protein